MKRVIRLAFVLVLVTGCFGNVWAKNCRELVGLAMSGELDHVKEYIDMGCDVNSNEKFDGTTALMMAAYSGHLEVVELLVKSGADVKMKDSNGSTALMNAAKNGHLEVVRVLVKGGANIRAKNILNMTAMMLAESKGHDKVYWLLKKSALRLTAN